MMATGIRRVDGRESRAPAPVDQDQTALAAALVDQQIDGDFGRVVGIVGVFEIGKRPVASTTRTIASPSPVHDTPPSELSA
jgi:hypothetical protein